MIAKFTRFFRNKTLAEQTAMLFAVEGIFLALMINIINNNNNLFATRLGASDFQISLVVSLPQFIGMLTLIPGGILTDRLSNKRKMVVASLMLIAMVYILIGFVPLFGTYKVIAFFSTTGFVSRSYDVVQRFLASLFFRCCRSEGQE